MNTTILSHYDSDTSFLKAYKDVSLSAHLGKLCGRPSVADLIHLYVPKNKYRLTPISNRELEKRSRELGM